MVDDLDVGVFELQPRSQNFSCFLNLWRLCHFIKKHERALGTRMFEPYNKSYPLVKSSTLNLIIRNHTPLNYKNRQKIRILNFSWARIWKFLCVGICVLMYPKTLGQPRNDFKIYQILLKFDLMHLLFFNAIECSIFCSVIMLLPLIYNVRGAMTKIQIRYKMVNV